MDILIVWGPRQLPCDCRRKLQVPGNGEDENSKGGNEMMMRNNDNHMKYFQIMNPCEFETKRSFSAFYKQHACLRLHNTDK